MRPLAKENPDDTINLSIQLNGLFKIDKICTLRIVHRILQLNKTNLQNHQITIHTLEISFNNDIFYKI